MSWGPGGRRVAARAVLAAWAIVTVVFIAQASPSPAATTVYRVNAGGPKIASSDGGPAWQADTALKPSLYLSSPTGTTRVLSTTAPIALTTAAPATALRDARSATVGSSETWSFPSGPGEYQVNLYLAEVGTNTQAVNKRRFDVWLEGGQVEDELDVFKVAAAG